MINALNHITVPELALKTKKWQPRNLTKQHLRDHGVHHREVVHPLQPGRPPRRLQRLKERQPGERQIQLIFLLLWEKALNFESQILPVDLTNFHVCCTKIAYLK